MGWMSYEINNYFTSPGLLAEDAYDKEAGATTSEGVLCDHSNRKKQD